MYDNPMHHLYQVREKSEEDRSKYLFNADTLFYRYATEGYAALPDELYYYYHDYVSYMNLGEAEKEVERMRDAARRYKSKALANEADLMKVSVLDYYKDSLLQVCNRIVREVAVRAGKEGDAVSRIRAMNFDFISNYRTGHYAYAFAFAPCVVEELNKLTDRQYTERREMFSIWDGPIWISAIIPVRSLTFAKRWSIRPVSFSTVPISAPVWSWATISVRSSSSTRPITISVPL